MKVQKWDVAKNILLLGAPEVRKAENMSSQVDDVASNVNYSLNSFWASSSGSLQTRVFFKASQRMGLIC